MAKILAIGDLHFMKDELPLADLIIQHLTQCIEETKPNMLVFLGDILHTHSKIDMKAFNKAVGFFKTLAVKYPVFIIIGNHDRPDATTNLTDTSAFFCLRDAPNIYVIDRVLDISYPLGNNKKPLRFIFVPYVPPGTFDRALGTLQRDFNDSDHPVSCVFAHQTFVGASHGKTIVRSGDEWDINNPLLISGHIHVHKVLQPNLIYAGTPYQIRFDDESKKGVILATFDGSPEPDIRFIELNIRKRKAVTLKSSEVDNFVPPANCEVKIEIIGSNSEISDLSKKGIINRMRSKGVSVSLLPDKTSDPRNPENKSLRELVVDSIKDDPEAMEVYSHIFDNPDYHGTTEHNQKEKLTNLMELMRNMGGSNMTDPLVVGEPTEIREIKETPPYMIDGKGRKNQPLPSLAELQNSLKDSAKTEKPKKEEVNLQSILDGALSKANKK